MFHERHSRSVLKSLTWTLVAFLVTTVALFVIQRDLVAAAGEAVVIQIVKFIFFYFHERIWNKSNYGQSIKAK